MDQIKFALRNLAAFGQGFIPSQIATNGDFYATRDDAREIEKDLLLVAKRADAVILSYGRYLLAQGVIRQADLKLFTDQLENALTGNALFAIADGVEKQAREFA